MHLDLLTLVAMGSFVAACAGAVLLVAWSQNRKLPALDDRFHETGLVGPPSMELELC
jgi:hypothetical protein